MITFGVLMLATASIMVGPLVLGVVEGNERIQAIQSAWAAGVGLVLSVAGALIVGGGK